MAWLAARSAALLLDAIYLAALVVALPWLTWRSLKTGRYRAGGTAKLLGAAPREPPPPNAYGSMP